MSEWATRAFFLYGGEPKLISPTAAINANTPSPSAYQYGNVPLHYVHILVKQPYNYQGFSLGFNPALASTPRSVSPASPIQDLSSIAYSAKHNGLYIYVGRILRPLWSERIVVRVITDAKQQFVSIVLMVKFYLNFLINLFILLI